MMKSEKHACSSKGLIGFFSVLIFFLPTLQARAVDLYVALDGNDSNSGTIIEPLQTLSQAQTRVRMLLRDATGPINVWIRGGTYYLGNTLTFTSLDSGTSTSPIIYSNYKDETVVISGGFKITSDWSTYSGSIMKTNIGANKAGDLLFLNGAQQIMARYPNFDSSKIYLDGYAADAISPERVARWSDPSTGYIRALHSSMWGGNDYKITGKDADNRIQYTWVGDNNRGNGMHRVYRMVENLFEELDTSSEWFYDKHTGDLYFYPPEGTNLKSSTIEMASLEELIRIVGDSSEKARYLTFSGFKFTHVKRTLFSRTFEGLLRGDWAIVRAGAIFIQDAENITIKDCKFDQVGGNGVFMSGYNRNHLVVNNEFIDTGATCVQVVGLMSACRYPSTWSNHLTNISDTIVGPLTEDYPKQITISQNYMVNMGRFEKQSAGVNISMSEGVTVQHNTIHRSPRSGININDGTFGGHTIEYNDVFDCVRESGDHGPFNSWGRDRFWSYLGYDTNGNRGAEKYPYCEHDAYKTTVIRNNRFHYSNVHEWGIDLDDGSSNYQIYNNLCLNTGFKLREGFNRHVYNNIIVNERANIHCTYENAYNKIERNVIINDTPIAFANSSTQREITAHSHFDYNIFWNHGEPVSLPSNWNSAGFDTNSVIADPMFKNPANNDYTVTNQFVLQQTGFINFAMDQFGKQGCPTPPPISSQGNKLTSDPESFLGATITSIDAASQSVAGLPDLNGVFLLFVPQNSDAYAQGFRTNDVIRIINGKDITTKVSFWAIYNTLTNGNTVEIAIYRNQNTQTITFVKPDKNKTNKNADSIITKSVISLKGTDIYNGLRGKSFNEGWKFYKGDVNDGQNISIVDNTWEDVTLPHDWSIFNPIRQDSPASSHGGYMDGGIGWYRKTFTVPTDYKNKIVFINFDGAYMNSQVWINGNSLGTRPYGYSSFQYDLTPYLVYGGKNLIAVRINNNLPTSRWYSGSGIYRNVWLTVLNKTHVDYCGMFVTTPNVSSTAASVNVKTKVANQSDASRSVTLKTTILDESGNTVISNTSLPITINASNNNTFNQDITISNPKLWSPASPYLYMAKTQVMVDGSIVDTYQSTLGLRYFDFDVNEGFSLNGVKMKINGVCNHHDLGALGAAVNYRAIERQLEILKAMGCNALRTAHNPPDPQVLEVCDHLGIMVMDEAFDVWETGKNNLNDYHLYFNEWAQADIQSMVLRDRNHPSVIMWSIGNEIQRPSVSTATRLRDWVKDIDTTRPVTWACNSLNGSTEQAISNLLDIVGHNYFPERYDMLHQKYPEWKMIGSETSSAVRSRGIYKTPTNQKIIRDSDFQCSSYDNSVGGTSSAETSYRDINSRSFISGEFIWTGFDYIGETYPYEWPSKSSYFGIIDTCGFPKDIYYFYQSRWTTEPMVHILPHWNWPSGQNVEVWTYTNCDSVELFLNGVSQGVKTVGDSLHLAWNIPWNPGTIIAKGIKGDTVVYDKMITAGEAAKVKLKPDQASVIADGKDLVFIEVDICDNNDVLVPNADNLVTFSISGPGTIVGVDNGNSPSSEPYKANKRKAFSGKCLVIIQTTKIPGSIEITADSNGLSSGNITIFSTEEANLTPP
jgi:beta-galactosidase